MSAGTSFTLPAVIVTLEESDIDGSVTDVAMTSTGGVAGSEAGAVYVVGAPLAVVNGETFPHSAAHAGPSCQSVQVTPLLAVSLPTVAMNS
jgi:hypothetical protein